MGLNKLKYISKESVVEQMYKIPFFYKKKKKRSPTGPGKNDFQARTRADLARNERDAAEGCRLCRRLSVTAPYVLSTFTFVAVGFLQPQFLDYPNSHS